MRVQPAVAADGRPAEAPVQHQSQATTAAKGVGQCHNTSEGVGLDARQSEQYIMVVVLRFSNMQAPGGMQAVMLAGGCKLANKSLGKMGLVFVSLFLSVRRKQRSSRVSQFFTCCTP